MAFESLSEAAIPVSVRAPTAPPRPIAARRRSRRYTQARPPTRYPGSREERRRQQLLRERAIGFGPPLTEAEERMLGISSPGGDYVGATERLSALELEEQIGEMEERGQLAREELGEILGERGVLRSTFGAREARRLVESQARERRTLRERHLARVAALEAEVGFRGREARRGRAVDWARLGLERERMRLGAQPVDRFGTEAFQEAFGEFLQRLVGGDVAGVGQAQRIAGGVGRPMRGGRAARAIGQRILAGEEVSPSELAYARAHGMAY